MAKKALGTSDVVEHDAEFQQLYEHYKALGEYLESWFKAFGSGITEMRNSFATQNNAAGAMDSFFSQQLADRNTSDLLPYFLERGLHEDVKQLAHLSRTVSAWFRVVRSFQRFLSRPELGDATQDR
jgi:hypothetical protein